MIPPTIDRCSPSSVREVEAFLAIARQVATLKEEHPRAYAALRALVDPYRATAKAALAKAKAMRVECGPIELHQMRRIDDAAVLLEAVGRQRFASIGGRLKTVEEVDIDRVAFDAAIAAGRVSKEVVAKVVSWHPAYKTLPALEIP